MNDNGVVFNNNAKQIAFNDEHYERMMLRYDAFKDIIENKITYYSNLELEKQRASYIRLKAFKKLDKHLVDFDTNFFVCAITLLITNYFIPYVIDRILSINDPKKQFEKAL